MSETRGYQHNQDQDKNLDSKNKRKIASGKAGKLLGLAAAAAGAVGTSMPGEAEAAVPFFGGSRSYREEVSISEGENKAYGERIRNNPYETEFFKKGRFYMWKTDDGSAGGAYVIVRKGTDRTARPRIDVYRSAELKAPTGKDIDAVSLSVNAIISDRANGLKVNDPYFKQDLTKWDKSDETRVEESRIVAPGSVTEFYDVVRQGETVKTENGNQDVLARFGEVVVCGTNGYIEKSLLTAWAAELASYGAKGTIEISTKNVTPVSGSAVGGLNIDFRLSGSQLYSVAGMYRATVPFAKGGVFRIMKNHVDQGYADSIIENAIKYSIVSDKNKPPYDAYVPPVAPGAQTAAAVEAPKDERIKADIWPPDLNDYEAEFQKQAKDIAKHFKVDNVHVLAQYADGNPAKRKITVELIDSKGGVYKASETFDIKKVVITTGGIPGAKPEKIVLQIPPEVIEKNIRDTTAKLLRKLTDAQTPPVVAPPAPDFDEELSEVEKQQAELEKKIKDIKGRAKKAVKAPAVAAPAPVPAPTPAPGAGGFRTFPPPPGILDGATPAPRTDWHPADPIPPDAYPQPPDWAPPPAPDAYPPAGSSLPEIDLPFAPAEEPPEEDPIP